MREKDGEKYIFVLNYQAEKIEYTLQKPMIALYDKTEATGRCTLPAFGTAVYKVIEYKVFRELPKEYKDRD